MRNLFLRSILACFSTFISTLSLAAISDLLPTEQNTIEVFQKISPNVVYVRHLASAPSPKNPQPKTIGAGSGIVWDNKGHIVTNFHVIKGAKILGVSIGGITAPAKVLGAEPRKDLAVLSVTTPEALKALANQRPFVIAHSKDLLVGQKTIAIGNPFGLDHSLTVGVVSALKRKVPGVGGVTIHDMIQTDASINPGNSGGPLLDSKGRLIGLNTVIYSNTGSSTGIGFAVPADEVERIVPQIINKGHAELAGIGVQRADPKVAARHGIQHGILIANTLPNTPAEMAGLHKGDVIVAVNQQAIADYDAFYNLLAGIKVADNITVTVIRGGKTLNYTMKTIDVDQPGRMR